MQVYKKNNGLYIYTVKFNMQSRGLQLSRDTLYLLSPRLCFFMVLNCDLLVYRDNSVTR